MASSPQSPVYVKATWDESNTETFLHILVEEIDGGNRPNGHFPKPVWNRMLKTFWQRSGCNFTMTQLKNKWDNLKKDFALWEKLLLEETWLGYDHTTSRIVADPCWWRNKLQVKPEYRKFKTHGPLHLDLQERVFRGVVATGYMEYLPEKDGFAGNAENEDVNGTEFGAGAGNGTNAEDLGSEHEPSPTPNRPTTTTPSARVSKRRKKSAGSTKTTDQDVNDSMLDLIDVMRQESLSSIQCAEQTGPVDYEGSLKTLLTLPWLDSRSSVFADLVVLLEDPVKRVAFSNLVHLGEDFIQNWVNASKKP